jgi:coenzyme F420 hydrogenase subunit beta
MDDFQPHQVAKKRAVWARFVGLAATGFGSPRTARLRVRELAAAQGLAKNLTEARGARRRAKEGRVAEPMPQDGRLVMGSCVPALGARAGVADD